MVLASEVVLSGPQSGDGERTPPQKPGVMPQKPKLLQQTLRGQVDMLDHWMPHPGSHSLFQSHCEMQLSPQKSGPPPQTPLPVTSSLQTVLVKTRGAHRRWRRRTYKAPQQPISHPFVAVQVNLFSAG